MKQTIYLAIVCLQNGGDVDESIMVGMYSDEQNANHQAHEYMDKFRSVVSDAKMEAFVLPAIIDETREVPEGHYLYGQALEEQEE